MSPAPIGFKIRRHTLKRRASQGLVLGILDDPDPTGLVKRRCFFPWVFDRHGVTAQFNACLKPVFFVCSFTDRNQELANLPTTGPVDAKHIPEPLPP